MLCPRCGGLLFHYDRVRRILRLPGGKNSRVEISRNKCKSCGAVLRERSDRFIGRKQYGAEVIFAVLEGRVDEDTLGYEDYPCALTMQRWRKEFHRSCFGVEEESGYNCDGGETK